MMMKFECDWRKIGQPTWHDITEMLKKQLKNISQALLVLLFIMFQPVQLHGNFYQ